MKLVIVGSLVLAAVGLALLGIGYSSWGPNRYSVIVVPPAISANGTSSRWFPPYRIDTYTGKTWAYPDNADHWTELKEQ